MKDLALGSFEAAAVMGVHFTRPKRLFDAGKIDGRLLDSLSPSTSGRQFAIYSFKSAEEQWKEHEHGRITTRRRPRAYVHLREPAIKRLATLKAPILYDDAIGTVEAAKILGVHWTHVKNLLALGKVIGRQPWNPRRSGGSTWIISRKSCEANRREVAAAEKAQKKRGRPRYQKIS